MTSGTELHHDSTETIDWAAARAYMLRLLRYRRLRADESALEDLAQEASIRLHRAVRREAPRNLEALMTDIAHKTALDHIRSRTRWAQLMVEGEPDPDRCGALPPAHPEHVGDPLERLRFLLLNAFDAVCPAVLPRVEARLDGLSWDEIVLAEAGRGRHVTAAALRKEFERAVAKVRTHLTNRDEFRSALEAL